MAELRKFQSQVGFQSAAQAGKFAPVQVADDSAQRRQNQQVQQNNMQQVLQARLNAFKIENATRDANIQALSNFSDTLWKALETGGKAAVQVERNRGARIAAEQVTQEQKQIWSQSYDQLVNRQVAADQASAAATKGNAPPLIADQIAELGGWARFEAERTKLGLLKDQVGSFLSKALLQAPPANEMDARAKVENALELFETASGLGNYNAVLINELYNPSANAASTKLLASYDQQFAYQRADESMRLAKSALVNNPFANTKIFFSRALSTINTKTGRLHTPQEVYALYKESLIDAYEVGLIKKEQVIKTFTTVADPVDPKKTFAEGHKEFYMGILKTMQATDISNFRDAEAQKTITETKISDAVLEVWAARAEAGNPISMEAGMNWIREARKRPELAGASFTRVTNYLTTQSQDAETKSRQEFVIINALQNNTASLDMLEGAHPDIVRTYKPQIEAQVNLTGNKEVKSNRKGIEGIVGKSVIGPKVTNGIWTPEARAMTTALEQFYDKRVRELTQTPQFDGNPEGASRQALGEARTLFTEGLDDKKSPFYYDKTTKTSPNILGTSAQIKTNTKNVQNVMQTLNNAVASQGADAFDNSMLFPNVDAMYQTWKTDGTLPGWFKGLARQAGINPLVAANQVFTHRNQSNKGVKPISNLNDLIDQRSQFGPRSRRILENLDAGYYTPASLQSLLPKENLPVTSTYARVTTPDTGTGYSIPEYKDRLGRPIVFGKEGALRNLDLIIKASNGIFKASDIESSQRSEAKNKAVEGSETSRHLEGTGLAMDLHGESRAWLLRNDPDGKKYGWVQVPYYSNGKLIEWHFEYIGD